jgi:D-alanyl-D-alanine carboxypeptidase
VDEVIAAVAPALESKIGAYRKKHRLPGIAAGIADLDGLRWWHASGFADLESGRRPDQRTLYRIASISKTITATAVLQLRDEGRLRLDDPAVRVLPELEAVQDPHGPIEDLTLRRLLMHTSGLQGEVPWNDLDRFWLYQPEETLGVMHLARVTTPPEVDHKYSNFAYELLGHVVERVSGRPFTEYVRASVLDPLGMRDTVWDPDPEQAARKAVGYDARAHDDVPPIALDVPSGVFVADGGLWSTLEDLGTWVAQQLRTDATLERGERQVLRGATLSEMHRPSFVADADWKQAQGLCWYGTREGETILIGHSGALQGFITNISFSPSGRVGAIVLLNGIAGASKLARELLDVVLPAAREAEDRAEVTPFVPIRQAWRELLGAYRDPELEGDFIVEWRDGKLVLLSDLPDVPPHDLEPTDDPLVFTIRGGRPGGEALVFQRGGDGRIDRCNAAGYPAMRVDLLRPPTWRTEA